jgi:outer membrane lipoprotein SlyB
MWISFAGMNFRLVSWKSQDVLFTRKTIIFGSVTVFLLTGLALSPAPAEAQKKGQSAKVQYGVVVKSERVDLSQNKAPTGTLVGGTIGLATGGSSGYKRRRNAAIGAAAGGILGAA